MEPEFLAINPRHKVSYVVDDGFALYESIVIVEYLDESRLRRCSPATRASRHACVA